MAAVWLLQLFVCPAAQALARLKNQLEIHESNYKT